MRGITTLLIAGAIAGLMPLIVTAAEPTGFGGVAINATETDVRAALADCRAIRTQLSRYACSIRTVAWGAPVLAMFVFSGEPERRLVVISLSFQPEDRDRIERGLASEYGKADAVKDGDPYWTRSDAAMWIRRERDRVMFARRDHIERANAPVNFPCAGDMPAHANASLNCE